MGMQSNATGSLRFVGQYHRIGGRRLTTAEILYHLPDHPALLQSFTWQCWDRAPNFPRLTRFLDYWSHNLDGVLHSVRVMQASRSGAVKTADYFHQSH